MAKTLEYFDAGVEAVWLIYPIQRFVQIFDSLSEIRGLTKNQILDGGKALPGFQLKLSELYPQNDVSSS